MAHVQIFLSTVSAEFRSYRDALRRDLERPNVAIKVQEDFIATGTETLDKLDEYIRQCDAVIHLVGDMTGALAQPPSVAVIRQRYSDLAERLPALDPFLKPDAPALSYTQWEAWLALYHRKVLIIAVPQDGAARDEQYQMDEVQRAAQQAHLERLTSIERFREISFATADRLAVDILRSGLWEILNRAGALKTSTHIHDCLTAHTRSVADRPCVPVNFKTVISVDGSVSTISSERQGNAEAAVCIEDRLPYLERRLLSIRNGETFTTILEIFERWRKGRRYPGAVVVMGAGAQGKTTELYRLVHHIRDRQDENVLICYLDLVQEPLDFGDGADSSFAIETMVHRTLRLPRELDREAVREFLYNMQPAVFLVDSAQASVTPKAIDKLFLTFQAFCESSKHRHLVIMAYRISGHKGAYDPLHEKLRWNRDPEWRVLAPYKIQPVEDAQIEAVMRPVSCFQTLLREDRDRYVKLLSEDLLMLKHCRFAMDEASLRSRGAGFYGATRDWPERCGKIQVAPHTILELAAEICNRDILSINPEDKRIQECLGTSECKGAKEVLRRLAGEGIITRQDEVHRYAFPHADYAYFCAALWIRYKGWEKGMRREEADYKSRLRSAVLRVASSSSALETIGLLPGVLQRLSDPDEDDEGGLYDWLRLRFVKWGEPGGSQLSVNSTSARVCLLRVAELYLDMQAPGREAPQLISLCEDALSLRDSVARYGAIEQLLNIFFRQAMAVAERGEIKALGCARIVEALTRSVVTELWVGKGWSAFMRVALPWVLQRYAPGILEPLVRRIYPVRVARIDSLLVLLLVLAGQAISTRAPEDAGAEEIEKVRKAREKVVQFVLRQCHTLLDSIRSSDAQAGRAGSSLLMFATVALYTVYFFNSRPCNFWQMKSVLFGAAAGTERDSDGKRTWLVRIGGLFNPTRTSLLQEKDWLLELCDKSQNGLVTWYAYTIFSIHGNHPETAAAVIELLKEISRDERPNGVRRYVAFHALRSLIFYSDLIRSDRSLYSKATEAFKQIAKEALLAPRVEPTVGHTLLLRGGGDNFRGKGKLARLVKRWMPGVTPPYDNEFLLYYAQFLCQTVKPKDVVKELTKLTVDYLRRYRGKDQIREFEYAVNTMARVGIIGTYTTYALEVLVNLQTNFGELERQRKALRAMQKAFDKVARYQPRVAQPLRGKSPWLLKESKVRDRKVAAEIYEPYSYYGDAAYQNSLFYEPAQAMFATATKQAAGACSMFQFFLAYIQTAAMSVERGELPLP